MLALRARFDAEAARGVRARLELRLGEDRFRIAVADGALDAVLWRGRSLAAARCAGDLSITGDAAAAERLLGRFPLPEPAAAA